MNNFNDCLLFDFKLTRGLFLYPTLSIHIVFLDICFVFNLCLTILSIVDKFVCHYLNPINVLLLSCRARFYNSETFIVSFEQ